MDFPLLLERQGILALCLAAIRDSEPHEWRRLAHAFAGAVADPDMATAGLHPRSPQEEPRLPRTLAMLHDPLTPSRCPVDGVVTVSGERAWCTVVVAEEWGQAAGTYSFVLGRCGDSWQILAVTMP